MNRGLHWCGKELAQLWLVLAGITMALAFPVSAIAASIFVGVVARWFVGPGTLGVIAFFSVAFFFGLFLSVYVWEPHLKSAVHRISEAIEAEFSN
jgi:hypothetical protein